MLTEKELEIVISTLKQRRSWFLKALKDAEVTSADVRVYRESAELLERAISKLAPGQEGDQAESLDLAKLKVLIVDDDEDIRLLLYEVLDSMGVEEIDQADDGPSALKLIQKASPPYPLILCDWNIPHLSGLHVLKAIRAEKRFNNTRVIMVTAVTDGKAIREAIKAGLNDYLVKPVDVATLETKIRRAAVGLFSNGQ